MYLIQGRFALALSFSTAAHVGLAWMVSDQLPSSAAPAQRALTVAMTPAAPRAVLNSIAPTASAALSPAVVRPLAPVSVQAIHEPDRVVAARIVDIVQALDAPLVEARGPKRHLRARDSRASNVALVAAVSRMRISSALQRETVKKPLPASLDPAPATSREVLPAPRAAATTRAPQSVDGKPGTGGQAHSPRAVAGQPGANREALPASGNEPPEYPWIARAQGHQGRVIISVWVGAEGQADELAVLQSSGYPNLDRAAVEAVRHWRFRPARRGGIETGSLLYVPVVFRLDE
ncbi:MAG: TonB family protein [Gammaproteobacteria bacterium]|nr:TonB family protein [Gammaproteobacteria bacterium]